VLERPIFYMGDERESRIHERMCKYVVNGERVGYGISEYCYRFLLLIVHSLEIISSPVCYCLLPAYNMEAQS